MVNAKDIYNFCTRLSVMIHVETSYLYNLMSAARPDVTCMYLKAAIYRKVVEWRLFDESDILGCMRLIFVC